MKLKTLFRTLIILCVLTISSAILFAQGPPVPNPPAPAGSIPGAPVGIPVDGGITILVAAGIGFGAKKIKDARKNNQVGCKHSAE